MFVRSMSFTLHFPTCPPFYKYVPLLHLWGGDFAHTSVTILFGTKIIVISNDYSVIETCLRLVDDVVLL